MKFLLRCSMFVLIPILALLLFVQSAPAIEWQQPAVNTIVWDEAGPVVVAPKTLTYRIYIAELTTKDAPIFIEEVSALVYTLSIPVEMGVYFAGVSSVLNYNDPANTTFESRINWSDIDENGDTTSTPVPFGWKLVFPPIHLSAEEPQ